MWLSNRQKSEEVYNQEDLNQWMPIKVDGMVGGLDALCFSIVGKKYVGIYPAPLI
jgi:hypothetical protein